MPDYTLLQEALELGGKVVSVVSGSDMERGHTARPQRSEDGRRSHPLSTPHTAPFVEYTDGASLLRVNKGGYEVPLIGGGKRGVIKGFSDESRRRLMQAIATVRMDATLPLFVTLTYPERFPEPKQAKRHLDIFLKRLKRAFPAHGSIWKLEPQERGAPHFHFLTWGVELVELREFVPGAWYEIAGGGDIKHLRWHRGEYRDNQHCVQAVRSWRGVWSYASKYLGKTFEVAGWADKWTGRYWNMAGRDNIPFGEVRQVEIKLSEANKIMRYQRRFTGIKARSRKSLSIFCDASQWVEKIIKKRTA